MTTAAAAPTRWAAQQVENAFASAVISGIVPDQAHLNTGGYHVSIEDLGRFGNGGDYSNRRAGDKSPPVTAWGRKLAAAFDISMGVADMKRVHANVRRVWLDRSDPRREYINAINCWDGSGDAVRYDFQANTAGYATPDHKWHKHSDQPRMYVDVYRNEAQAWLAARAIVSVITGQTRAAWAANEGDDMTPEDWITAKMSSPGLGIKDRPLGDWIKGGEVAAREAAAGRRELATLRADLVARDEADKQRDAAHATAIRARADAIGQLSSGGGSVESAPIVAAVRAVGDEARVKFAELHQALAERDAELDELRARLAAAAQAEADALNANGSNAT